MNILLYILMLSKIQFILSRSLIIIYQQKNEAQFLLTKMVYYNIYQFLMGQVNQNNNIIRMVIIITITILNYYSISAENILIFIEMETTVKLDKLSNTQKKIQDQQISIHESNDSSQQYPKKHKKLSYIKPCQKYGLDPQKLQIEHLLKYRNYRRLYNIVANDQTSAQQVFRPNLIKQLYFLLQITPFIEDSLKQNFLNKIQEWYNSNDHKKIQLSKNLDGIVRNALETKNKEKEASKLCNRPKSGIQWDTSLNSFLRPYTAKIRSNKNKKISSSNSQHKSINRPQSSKYGVSTNANTNFVEDQLTDNFEQEQQQFGEQFQEAVKNAMDLQQICDIEEERERSQDFRKKYRTIHPQEQPTYQKLMNLIQLYKGSDSKCQPPAFPNKLKQNKRKIQSAIQASHTKNAKILAQKQLNLNNQDLKSQNEQNVEQINDDQDDIEQVNKDNQDDDDDQNLNLNQAKGLFTSDKRSRQNKKTIASNGNGITNMKLYSNLNGVKILRPFTAKQTNIITKLNQYSQLQQNKKVIQSNFDQQCVQKYKEYVKNKNNIKRQILKKSQAKRYMNNFMSVVKVLPSKNKSKTMKTTLQQYSQQKQNKENILSTNLYDFTNNNTKTDQKAKANINSGFYSPKQSTYNVRKYFQEKKKQKIQTEARCIGRFDYDDKNQDISKGNKMTYQKRFISEQIFDPLHKNNLDNYNKQALEQIQKIKLRFGGKFGVCTDALVNALYVDAHSSYTGIGVGQKNQGGALELPDKRYLMIEKNQKKKKKLKKRINKSVSKSKR